ncbi:MAG: hypothetical protein AAF752_02580 [Bacteroidota bacterium]
MKTLWVFLFGCALMGCDTFSRGSSLAANTGVAVQAVLATTCGIIPDPNEIGDAGCVTEEPVEAVVRVLDGESRLVREFVTGSDGTFNVALAPGSYVLVATTDAPAEIISEVREEVAVQDGVLREVTLRFSTAIR